MLVDSYLSDAARQLPDTVAVVDGDVRLTYAELDRRVGSLAVGLAGLGVAAGDVVSWQLPNWHEAYELHHAILRLAAVSNPIVTIYRYREVGYILAQARSRVMVVADHFRGFDHAGMIVDLRPELPDLAHVVTVRGTDTAFDDLLANDPVAAPRPDRRSSDRALLMFTSGTTADPKGVLHTHETLDLENRSIIDVYGLGPSDVVFMPSPVTHITGLLYGLQLPAMLRTRVVLQDLWEPTVALGLIEGERCTFTLAATPFLHGLVHDPKLADHDTSSLRVFACGGADVPPALIRQADERLGCRTTRVYGSTEFPTLTTSPPGAPIERRAGTDGCVIGAAEFRILDEFDRPLDAGTTGELVLRGPELFSGYLRPADEAGVFTADGWFRTGDLAAVDPAGYLTIRGRSKDVILRGGENISGVEVENLLFEHRSVREVAAVAMPDPVLVERMCVFVVPADGAVPTLEELVTYLEAHRMARQKLPERLELVAELPKTASGKVQKFRLREIVREHLAAMGADGVA